MAIDEGTKPSPLSKEKLKELLLDALNNAPDLHHMETFHARFDHLERGLQEDDVIHGIEREWDSFRVVRFNEDEWQWNNEIGTESVDGRPLTILVAVDTRSKLFEVITRWS
jgi:hypothetical protein